MKKIGYAMLSILILGTATQVSYARTMLKTYEDLTDHTEALCSKFEKEHGIEIDFGYNPQYLSGNYSGKVDEQLLNGTFKWATTFFDLLNKEARDSSKKELIAKRASVIILMPYSEEPLQDEVKRRRGSVTIVMTLESLKKAPPADFAEQVKVAIFEMTKQEGMDKAREELAPLRGKVSKKLTPQQIDSIKFLVANAALLKMGTTIWAMSQVGEGLGKAFAASLSRLAEQTPEEKKAMDQKIHDSFAKLPKDFGEKLKGMKGQVYQQISGLTFDEMKKTLTDSLIEDVLVLISKRPESLPDLSKELSDEMFFKTLLLRTSNNLSKPELDYFEKLSTWLELGTKA